MKQFVPDIYSMLYLSKSDTGLAMIVWIMPAIDSIQESCIYVQADYCEYITENRVAISIEYEKVVCNSFGELRREDLSEAYSWIELNRQVLLDYWYGRIASSIQVVNILKTLK